ncbi:hypothetical protein [Methylobacterium sp. J-068]|uniref:hypothetical protein n=1 Tax=Methylobacterium sp. J-068 TaxID=2836649 RepID=UPI001FBB93BC|nr:hypothetical protein [Methylobacterium sp. J-068]MCJ2036434.1 hypothetical protein [Methylobacterium sp. J-068]
MTAISISGRSRTASVLDRPHDAKARTARMIAFAATLVLAATTGLPMRSVANLMPQADDRDDSFLGI